MITVNSLRQRLALALNLKVKDTGVKGLAYYATQDDAYVALIQDWEPSSAENILQVIEQYGLNVERTVKVGTDTSDTDNIQWVYNVWSRNPVYRVLTSENLCMSRPPKIKADSLTLAVFEWAVLRIEYVNKLKADPVLSPAYDFSKLEERVYVYGAA